MVMGNHCRTMLVVAMLALAPSGVAYAQSNSGAAQSLFEEGVRLMKEKKYAEACPKLAESHKLEPGGGTVFNLAICLEEEGKLASAYVAYDEALARAKKDNNTKRAQLVEQRMTALKPKLSRVTISVAKPADPAAKLEVRFDGTPLGEQAWGVPFYADVGMHTVTAEAPGYKSFKTELEVKPGASQYATNVPALDKDPNAAVASDTPSSAGAQPKEQPKDSGTVVVAPPEGRGALPYILVGTGIALIGAGTVTGILAFSKHSDSDAECPEGRCTAKGVDAENQANTFAWISNITLPLGVIAAGVGAYLFIKKPSSAAPASARLSPTSSGLLLHGAF